ncbi:MAG: sulfite exporter TauE/SafE family protein [Candidatus Pacebacteria bacterium]|nr:sulfite exporter TauE/SafE family protein [Candidatus Paceibacterota bacterium]
MATDYPIAGMHCRSCEILVEQHIQKVPGVQSVEVHHRTGIARVTPQSGQTPNEDAIKQAIRDAGYTPSREQPRPWIVRDSNQWIEAMVASCLVFVLYIAARLLGITSMSASIGSSVGIGVAIVVGLTAGVSTCAALVGGLVLGFSARHADTHPHDTLLQRLRPHAFFHLGRIVGFALFGGVIGFAGSALQPSALLLGVLTMIVGVVMISLGIKLTELVPRVDTLLTLPPSIARTLVITAEHAYSHWRAMLTGALTFFVPCGFTQAIQLAAVSSASAAQGALMMGAFAVGTTPGLLGIAALSSLVRGPFARFLFKVIGVLVIGLGVWNMSNGLTLSGIALPSLSEKVQGPLAELRGGTQYLTMKQGEIGYSPNTFTIRKGVPFVWTITSTSSYTCASTLSVPSLGIQKNLALGDNVITFTPSRSGTIRFSCSMGMFGGEITVID